MAQPQEITYPYDLFRERIQDVIRPFPTSEAVCGARGIKALQVKEAGERERALTHDLMSLVLSHDNIREAYKQVKRDKGVPGIDQMPTGKFSEWYSHHAETLLDELYNGSYRPQGVKQVEIPKPNGGKRKLGIPTVTDRIIQQAISQVLIPIYERKFSGHSYGFRPNRSARQALKKGGEYVSGGRTIVVDMDLKTFFDVVNHDRLMYPLSTWIRRKLRCYRLKQCKRVITLQQFLKSHGVETWQSWILALSGKGLWCKPGCPQAHQALSNKWFNEAGLYNLSLNYARLNH